MPDDTNDTPLTPPTPDTIGTGIAPTADLSEPVDPLVDTPVDTPAAELELPPAQTEAAPTTGVGSSEPGYVPPAPYVDPRSYTEIRAARRARLKELFAQLQKELPNSPTIAAIAGANSLADARPHLEQLNNELPSAVRWIGTEIRVILDEIE